MVDGLRAGSVWWLFPLPSEFTPTDPEASTSTAVPPLQIMFSPLILLLALPLIHAAAVPNTHDSHDHNHSHDVRQSLPTDWYQAPDHPVHKLFKRAAPGDGTNYAPVGTPGRKLTLYFFHI